MFSPRDVCERARKKLAILRNVTQESVHDVYEAIMYEEIRDARGAVARLRILVTDRAAHHPGKGWIMVTPEQQAEVVERLRDIEAQMTPR